LVGGFELRNGLFIKGGGRGNRIVEEGKKLNSDPNMEKIQKEKNRAKDEERGRNKERTGSNNEVSVSPQGKLYILNGARTVWTWGRQRKGKGGRALGNSMGKKDPGKSAEDDVVKKLPILKKKRKEKRKSWAAGQGRKKKPVFGGGG